MYFVRLMLLSCLQFYFETLSSGNVVLVTFLDTGSTSRLLLTLLLLQALDSHQQVPQPPPLHPLVLPLACQPPQLRNLLHSQHLHCLAQPLHLLNRLLRLALHHHRPGSPCWHLPLGWVLQQVKQHQHLDSLWHPVQRQRSLCQQQRQGSPAQALAALG